jgi:MinD superfamily P-loop ATPase
MIKVMIVLKGYEKQKSCLEFSREKSRFDIMLIGVTGTRGGIGASTLAAAMVSRLMARNQAQEIVLVRFRHQFGTFGPERGLEAVHQYYRNIPKWIRSKCSFCNQCVFVCMHHAIVSYTDAYLVYPELCVSCSSCRVNCPSEAIELAPREFATMYKETSGKITTFTVLIKEREVLTSDVISETCRTLDSWLKPSVPVILDLPSASMMLLPTLLRCSHKIVLVTGNENEAMNVFRRFPDEAVKVLLASPAHFVLKFKRNSPSSFVPLPWSFANARNDGIGGNYENGYVEAVDKILDQIGKS